MKVFKMDVSHLTDEQKKQLNEQIRLLVEKIDPNSIQETPAMDKDTLVPFNIVSGFLLEFEPTDMCDGIIVRFCAHIISQITKSIILMQRDCGRTHIAATDIMALALNVILELHRDVSEQQKMALKHHRENCKECNVH